MRLWPGGGLWRHGDFLRLWSAETISQVGTQVSQLAIPFVAILVLDASPFEVSLLLTIQFAPFILFSLPAGVWVDRLPRRMILVVGDLGRAAALATIPLAYWLDVLSLGQLYVVGFAVGVLTVFFDVAYQAYLPSLVERDELVEGNSKLEISRSGAQLVGPAFAGVLIQAIKAPAAILVDSISFLVSGLFVLAIKRRERGRSERRAEELEKPSMRREIMEGLRFVLGHRYLRGIAACTATSNFFSSVAFAIFLVYAVRELGLDPAPIGIIFGVSNVGFLAGAIVANRISARLGVGRTILWSAFIFGPAAILIPLAPRSAPEPFIVVSFALIGFGAVIYNITQLSLRQAITPERLQGRMNSVMRFIVWGAIPLGQLVGGVLGSTIGLRETLFVGAIGGAFAFLPILLSPVRKLERIPEPVDETLPGETEAALATPPGGHAGSAGVPAQHPAD